MKINEIADIHLLNNNPVVHADDKQVTLIDPN